MSEVVLQVKGLYKRFGKTEVLKGLSFQLHRGEVLGVLGPNGAGKTTLIHILLGLIEADRGEIHYFGLEFAKHRSKILQRINFGSTYTALPYSLTLLENLRVYSRIYGVSEDRCHKLLKLFGLYELKDFPARRLSTGQMTRLCLSKALINDPEILLLDEPTAGLDPEIAKMTRQMIMDLVHKRHISVIYTSHNLREIEEVAHRVIFLHNGVILTEGSTTEILKSIGARSLEEFFFEVIKK